MNVGLILWAGNDPNHGDHLHVQCDKVIVGYTDGRGIQPPKNNPGMTDGIRAIYSALTKRFGPGDYFVNPDPGTEWFHMGYYNRRPISGSVRWSQHAYGNALDIGPYYGKHQQQLFYDFLTGKEGGMDYEIIGGVKWYDVDLWPSWADASIRASIVSGDIKGKDVRDDKGKIIGKRFDPNAPLTRAELAVVLDRNNLL